MDKYKVKQNIVRICFILGLLLTLWYFDEVLCVYTMHGSSQARTMYYQPRNKIDVIMLGSSHVHCDINPAVLWEEYGMTAYDYSAAEQPLWITYYYLKEVCRYQNPKIIVLELYSPARFKDDYQYQWLNENLCGMRLSLNKLGALFAGCEKDQMKNYFPSFAVYHARIDTLTKEDFIHPLRRAKTYADYKGFAPFFDKNPQIRPELKETSSGGLTPKSELYLQKIIDYAKKNEIELYLLVSPYIVKPEDEPVYNRLKEIAELNDLPYNNMNYEYDEIGLDFSVDFNEESHLNYRGAKKYTSYLGKELKNIYNIEDHRGQKGYESWDRNCAELAVYDE